jgi:CoA:oxalate CoA-transferase
MIDSKSRLFSGLRVLDLTRVMSGPFCTAMLADLGADVTKIEIPGFGEESRHFAPHVKGESTYFAMLNRGKRSMTVNLKSSDGVEIVKDLARRADVLVENFRPGVMERLGLGQQALRELNPRLVYASISGFGQDGPFRDWPAFDLVIQAMSGLMSLTGEPDGRPTAVGESIADVASGMFAAWGIAAALYDRERTGQGCYLEVAMLDSVFSMLLTSLARRLFTDRAARRVGNRHPETYPVDSFSTRDGDIVLVAFSDQIFRQLMDCIGRPELARDSRFSNNSNRNAHESELREAIASWTSGLTQGQALERLREAGVPAAPVWSLDQLLASGHLQARGAMQEGINAVLGKIPLVPQPVRFSGFSHLSQMRTPVLGEDTDTVLRSDLGLTESKIAALRAAKAI